MKRFFADSKIVFQHMGTPKDAKFCDAISGDPGISKTLQNNDLEEPKPFIPAQRDFVRFAKMSSAMEEVVVATVDETLVEANIIDADMSGAITVEAAGETDNPHFDIKLTLPIRSTIS